MSLKSEISKNKRELKKHVNNVNRLLAKEPQLQARFNDIINKNNAKTYGALNGYDSPMVGRDLLAEEEQAAEDAKPSWYESPFMKDLFNTGIEAAKSSRINRAEQKQLSLELQQIEAKNASLDKQISLQDRLSSARKMAGGVGGEFVSNLMNSPMAIGGIAGLAGLFIWLRMKKKR